MPDITMCIGGDCPKKHQCYRFVAEPDDWQSFSDFNETRNGDDCGNFRPSYKMKEKSNEAST